MEVISAIENFKHALASAIVWGLVLSIGSGVLYVFLKDYLRTRAAANRRIWKDL